MLGISFKGIFARVVCRQNFPTNVQSVGAASQLTSFNRQVGRGNQIMARRLADLSQNEPKRRLTSADGAPPKILKRIPPLTIRPREMETLLV